MHKLKGFLGSKKHHFDKGVTIGRDGQTYNILNFGTSDVSVKGIAKSLAKQCRYVGNIGLDFNIYSVAQHSVTGARAFIAMGEIDLAYDFLFHDSAEGYVGDLSAPLKGMIKDIIKPIEASITKICAEHLGFRFPLPEEVDIVDKNLAQYEITCLIAPNKVLSTDYWDVETAYTQFIETYNQLQVLKSYTLDISTGGMNADGLMYNYFKYAKNNKQE